MSASPVQPDFGPSVQAYLLGQVEYDVCLALQNRLVYESTGRSDGQIALLLCEHPPVITVGRRGSRAHVRFSQRELLSHRLEVRWVNHGGGCQLHLPGQLAVYPIVPLQWHGFTVGEYLDSLQAGVRQTLEELGLHPQTRPGVHGLWGRKGQLVSLAVAVKSWTTYHGAFVNVCPGLELFRGVCTDPEGGTSMSSLVAERQQRVKMTSVREGLVRHLTAAFGCDRFHLYTGHPLLPDLARNMRPRSRVG